MAEIPEDFKDLFEKKSFASFTTIDSDGFPHVTPVWIDFDGKNLLVNTVEGRLKEKNVRNNKKVGVSIMDPDDPYRHLSIRGKVIETTKKNAVEHIDNLAKKYMGVDEYPNRSQEKGDRIILKISPNTISTMEN